MTETLLPEDLKVLERVRGLVEATHWTQRIYADRDYAHGNPEKELYCLTGMVNRETGAPLALNSRDPLAVQSRGDIPARQRILTALRHAILDLYPRTADVSIERWNDHQRRRRAHVLRVIDRALGKE